jgi:hypothetical protein
MSPGRHSSQRGIKRVAERAAGSPTGFGRVWARITLWLRRLDTKQRVMAGGAGVVVLALVVGGVVTAASGSSAPRTSGGHHHRPHTVSSTSTTQPKRTKKKQKPQLDGHLCPLTGQPAPGGKVPQRPAEGVKIGNDPTSRPQSGLGNADIVYEEMAEGGITRYLAVFQCTAAPQLGPVRSVRWDDWHVLQSFGHPILAFSGGIDQWNTVVAQTPWLFDANGSYYPTANAYYRTANRVAPWNYYTTSDALWKLDKNTTTPPPQFTYSKGLPHEASAASQATIDAFATGTSVVWKWNAPGHDWMRFYANESDVDASGAQLHAANVVIQYVTTQPGAYAESGSTPDTDSITVGSGKVYVLRDGHVEAGTWNCAAYGNLTTFRFADGKAMSFKPGNTWVELVPIGYNTQLVG